MGLHITHNESLIYFGLGGDFYDYRKKTMWWGYWYIMFAVFFYSLYLGWKICWILRNPFWWLCGIILPTWCTHDSNLDGHWQFLIAGWHFAKSSYLLVDSFLVHCRIKFVSGLLWSFIYFVSVKWKGEKQQILCIRMENREWLGLGIFSLSAWHPFFRMSV